MQHLDLTNVTLAHPATQSGRVCRSARKDRRYDAALGSSEIVVRFMRLAELPVPIALLLFGPVVVNIAFFHALLVPAGAGQGRW